MESRNPRLKKIFDDILNGDKQVDGPLIPHFIKSISTHPDPAACLHSLVTSECGLKAVQTAVCSDPSAEFLNGSVGVLLAYLRDSKLEYLGGGDILQRLLRTLVEAPEFWNSLVTASGTGKLQQSTERSFSWLFFQLVVSPPELAKRYREVALVTEIVEHLLRSPDPETRSNGRKINHITSLYQINGVVPSNWVEAPGWRHDNDPRLYRAISILPTPDEIDSTERPSLRTVDQIDDLGLTCPIEAFEAHAENQFRLLREDLVSDTRESVQIALGKKRGKRAGEFIENIRLTGIYTQDRSKWGLKFDCEGELPHLLAIDQKHRKAHLEKERNFLRQGSFACLLSGNEVIAFVTIIRDIDLLLQNPPSIAVQFGDRSVAKSALHKLQRRPLVSLAQINTPLFAYEPVLRSLREMRLVRFLRGGTLLVKPHEPQDAEGELSGVDQETIHGCIRDLEETSDTTTKITLDNAQTEAFVCGLTQKVALIQGPPGTGKSFIGALLVNTFYKLTSHNVLVCCFTNHALDQFLEDLLKQGIPAEQIVRLGSRASPTTQGMALSAQTHGYRFTRFDWEDINDMALFLEHKVFPLRQAFSQFIGQLSPSTLLKHIHSEHHAYASALLVPPADDDMILIGESGRSIGPTYLLSRWLRGLDAGVLSEHPNVVYTRDVWDLSLEERKILEARWSNEILEARTEAILDAGDDYNNRQAPISAKFQQSARKVLCSKRIIACTTTGASIYRDAIHNAGPEILVVEEAGEVLESHVLTALSQDTQRLILIGDHKQLRPKVSSHELTVEKGEGYDLNRSLFERLVIEGHPYRTLSKQHRMRPEISALVRHLMYPNLTDGPGTGSRPPIRGLRNTVIFVDHKRPEDDDSTLSDPRYLGTTTSKRNKFEVDMIVKIVKYLKQQGYGSGEMTVLTPYLGQLVLLREELQTIDQVMFGERDVESLEVAGLAELLGMLGLEGSNEEKQALKVSTIGEIPHNYQGEENDIIIASLTRSNEGGKIGFMSSPERLNVLLSRARTGLIVVGDSETFLKSESGKELWTKFFDMIKRLGYFYEGLPVRCEQHNDFENVLRLPKDFAELCPDGGCIEPWFVRSFLSLAPLTVKTLGCTVALR
ncbi:P-loop containing nucleoside triphosphate hydrolase protein [Thelephora terrestris]|uniref:P-loop containing nucleoside triphosphate hydrolase protein n=1 Tax=Thelephora terrestris TaxID=56493 RepID=A0A9P6HNP8_9AGAM|nr:P-loop containing nucleoside triphosphate hydrolase protein [Thelephora terrestris]